MIFAKSSGTLELPTAGVYYIYYQIMFRPISKNMTLQARCRVVGCMPDQRCNFKSSGSKYSYMQSELNLNPNGTYANSLSQGGLLHFPAGSTIAIVVNNSGRRASPQLHYDDHQHLTYFGAFLVDADPE